MIPAQTRKLGRRAQRFLRRHLATPVQKAVATPLNRRKYAARPIRCLEIGQGAKRIDGFETLNVMGGPSVDYIADASRPLPFGDETFDLVYASHVLEHIPWYRSAAALKEWARILKRGGRLEVWVPDGLKIARAFVDAEEKGSLDFHLDEWWRFNPERDCCVWMNGRCFSYGDGTGALAHPNWHRTLFSERYLRALFAAAGLSNLRRLSHEEVRGYDHGWINLGLCGGKP